MVKWSRCHRVFLDASMHDIHDDASYTMVQYDTSRRLTLKYSHGDVDKKLLYSICHTHYPIKVYDHMSLIYII